MGLEDAHTTDIPNIDIVAVPIRGSICIKFIAPDVPCRVLTLGDESRLRIRVRNRTQIYNRTICCLEGDIFYNNAGNFRIPFIELSGKDALRLIAFKIPFAGVLNQCSRISLACFSINSICPCCPDDAVCRRREFGS